jgi:Flp pilus assembly protein TadD
MRPHSLLFVLALALCPQLVPAQTPTPPAADPRQMSDVARKAYSKGLTDARDLIAKKKYAEAIDILDKLSAERPREPQARFLKGVALSDSGKTDEAIVIFTALLADFPELPEVRNNLAVLYAQKGNYEGARDELVAALLAAPDYAIAYENLGDVYTRLAGVNYEKAIARDPRNRSAPPKLQLVRDVLGMRSAPTPGPELTGPPEPAGPPAPAAADTPAPDTAAAAAETPK